MMGDSGKVHEIGECTQSINLINASLRKYTSEDSKNTRLNQIIMFYERDSHLIAIQFIFGNSLSSNEIYTDPRIFGPINSYSTTNVIDKITLTLQEEEEIYLINGNYDTEKLCIINMGIFTTLGQFVEFGKSTVKPSFSWEFYYNLRNFDGFIVGWTSQGINYLGSLSVEKTTFQNFEDNIVLTDITYDTKNYLVEPIYLSTIYGKISSKTNVEDEILTLNIMDGIKDGTVYLSNIVIYYEKYVNCMEVEYTNKDTKDKHKVIHCGKDTKRNKDKKAVLTIEQDEYINYLKITHGSTINSLLLKTSKNQSLNCMSFYEGEFKAILTESSNDKALAILGFIVGHSENIHSLECYYEKRSLSDK